MGGTCWLGMLLSGVPSGELRMTLDAEGSDQRGREECWPGCAPSSSEGRANCGNPTELWDPSALSSSASQMKSPRLQEAMCLPRSPRVFAGRCGQLPRPFLECRSKVLSARGLLNPLDHLWGLSAC